MEQGSRSVCRARRNTGTGRTVTGRTVLVGLAGRAGTGKPAW